MTAHIKFEKKQNINVLLERLKSIAKVNEDGHIITHSFEIEDIKWNLLSIIDFGQILNVETHKNIINQAFKEVLNRQSCDKTSFIEILNNQIRIYNKVEEKSFILLATLAISGLPFRKIKIGDSIIQVHGKTFPKIFSYDRVNLLKSNQFEEDIPSYTKVSLEIKSKDYKDAYTKGMYYLEIFRSFLCILLNHSFEMRFGERTRSPINRILKGEVLSLHHPDGKIANSAFYYYTPDYKPTDELILERDKAIEIKLGVKKLVKDFNNCKTKHQNTIGQTLNCYVDAFDQQNYDISFLKAWTALEIITNTDQNDELIKRCLSIYPLSSKPYLKQRLEALRLYRNEFIHEGDRGIDSFHPCFKVKGFLDNLILKFNLKYAGVFENIEEANLFLDNYNLDVRELKKRKRIIDRILLIKENKGKT